ncbi:MAG: cyclic nucleotide-binding domain-containing protein [Rhodocyclaceae bacterium]|nr:cyclic nucleotide-binding domain-containing protein [Rhodocyclaceae bacterium]MBX3666867.1 cyclic nucleotide-binding domain-containing protein [Rhodocyclaceae bacterium]
MDFSGFFDYPGDSDRPMQTSLVFLPEHGENTWRVLLSFTERRPFRSGDEVLRAGDTGRAIYIVGRGSLEVVVPDKKKRGKYMHVAELEEGSVFGEQAFFDAQARSATVRALSDGEMHVLSLDSFEVLGAHHPELAREILFDLGRILSLRLRHTTAFAMDVLR